MWSPHGTDVLLSQFEHMTSAGDFAQPWFGVHDHSGDLVGVVDSDGTVREQRSFSPYGELLYVATFGKASGGAAPATNPVVKLGHDGLFFDRFNANILTPPHAVGARAEESAQTVGNGESLSAVPGPMSRLAQNCAWSLQKARLGRRPVAQRETCLR